MLIASTLRQQRDAIDTMSMKLNRRYPTLPNKRALASDCMSIGLADEETRMRVRHLPLSSSYFALYPKPDLFDFKFKG